MTFPWTCPFCGRDTTIVDSNVEQEAVWFGIPNRHGPRRVFLSFIVCPNSKCTEFALTAAMTEYTEVPRGRKVGKLLNTWRLIPPSTAKVFPDYVPKAIRDDYLEASLIKDLSPKASATLARRCLQGMIRDFWGIKKARLSKEIEALKDRVEALTWKAIDAVRRVGNIGAHMEKDINLIVDVEPHEAEKLIGLIELLIRDWYISRQERQERLTEIVALAEEKKPKPKTVLEAGATSDTVQTAPAETNEN